jgi:IclR family transcriptional regulator, pca regulon regulatory protein
MCAQCEHPDYDWPVVQERDTDFVQSLERGLMVIRTFSEESREQTLAEVARRSGLNRASARRFLLTLEKLGYVGSDGRRFWLRPKILDLGYASYLASTRVWDGAQPHMQLLVASVHESSSATVLDGDDIVYVMRVPTKRIMTVNLTVGTRLPAYPTSMGRVLLAHLPPDQLDAYLDRIEPQPLTARTVTDKTQLRTTLDQVRRQGWALVDQELEEGVRSVALPLHGGDGTVIAAINLSGHAGRISLETLVAEFLPALRNTVTTIERDIKTIPASA